MRALDRVTITTGPRTNMLSLSDPVSATSKPPRLSQANTKAL